MQAKTKKSPSHRVPKKGIERQRRVRKGLGTYAATPQSKSERRAFIESLCGKYAGSNNSSEDFARRKGEEIELEEHVRKNHHG